MPVVIKEVVKYQCSLCEAVYTTERRASTCEKKCTKAKEDRELAEKVKHEMRLTCASISEIEAYMEKHLKELSGADSVSVILNVRYTPQASNSHASPIGGVMNWCGREADKPIDYEGWVGNIEVSWTGDCKIKKWHSGYSDYMGSDEINIFKGVNTHSGSAGRLSCRYGVTLFCLDFPLMTQKYKEAEEVISQAVKNLQVKEDEAYTLTTQDKKYQELEELLNENYKEIAELERQVILLRNKYHGYQNDMRTIKEKHFENICKEAEDHLAFAKKQLYNITCS